MKPSSILPHKAVALYDNSLIAHLPSGEAFSPYALVPAPGLGRIMGVPWWQALTLGLKMPVIFDADDAPALAASALRAGETWVICTATGPCLETVKDMARLCGGHILTSRPQALTLGRPPYNAYRIAQLHQYLAPDT
ncbi:hypothetical protein ACFFGF_08075 [Asaia lannensis]|uniref:Uncharacterized protein n=1 Tax=Asaia lannensis NBRC 102526 TaxID=1307926 RepID=A0ABT1CLG1_9PROT|nr:hypothetical protein [Asaia lannensis]MCO6161109.1 hypothetical protein [Asaia lannensis NBRC 102526]GBR01813.1 hypothetical protein AA102526_2628 [Asaia lannensis NBRC 102526]